jgi:hypothetical protein
MSTVFLVLAIAFALGTLLSLFGGLFMMGRGGENDGRRSNKMMQYRVLMQGGAVLCLVLWWFSSRG